MAPPDEASAPRLSYWTLYTSPRGRIPRSIVWKDFWLPISLLSFGAELFGGGLLTVGIFLCIVWPGFVGFLKRLHDIDVSLGRYMAWLAFGIGVAVLASVIPVSEDLAGLIGIAAFIPLLVLNWKFYFFRGTQGSNRYGPDPLEEDWSEDHITPLDWRRANN
jgi:uncharacterized membrane protein YhaH (DUF805 family)